MSGDPVTTVAEAARETLAAYDALTDDELAAFTDAGRERAEGLAAALRMTLIALGQQP